MALLNSEELNPTDQWHTSARDLSRSVPGPLLTTEFVLMEVGDGMSQPENRGRFARLLELFRTPHSALRALGERRTKMFVDLTLFQMCGNTFSYVQHGNSQHKIAEPDSGTHSGARKRAKPVHHSDT